MAIPFATGRVTIKRIPANTQSATPNVVLAGVRAVLEQAKDGEVLALMATPGIEDLAKRIVFRCYIGGKDENPGGGNWRIKAQDRFSYTGNDPDSQLNGEYRVIADTEPQEGYRLAHWKMYLVRETWAS